VQPDRYYQLQQHGINKQYHADFDIAQAEAVLEKIIAETTEPAQAATMAAVASVVIEAPSDIRDIAETASRAAA
jgi:hypothetical protein